ncbi:MAG: AMP-binding protein [Acidobacteriota bacterium]|nr:AMP-binding protein [Acidobacteriota bacterium]
MRSIYYSEEQLIAANQNLKEKNYWLKHLAGEWIKSSFPYDFVIKHSVPGYQPKEPEEVDFKFSDSLTSSIMNICGGNDYTLHILLLAGLMQLLNKYTGINDIIVGTPIYKQEADREFINTLLAVRAQLSDGMTFKDLLLRVRETLQEAVEHQNFPVEILAEQLNIPAAEGDFRLFDTVVLLENIHEPKYLQRLHLHLHLIFSFLRVDGGSIEGKVEYNPLVYRKSTIQGIISNLIHLLNRALPGVNVPLSLVNFLSEEERNQLLFHFNRTDADYPNQKTLHLLFEEQVEKTPHKIAVVATDGIQCLSYNQLNEMANRLARMLRKRGLGSDKIAGILMDNSLDMVVSILAILKAGGAYLPISADLPEARSLTMLDDSSASLLLTKDELICKFKYINFQNFEGRCSKKIVTPKRPQVMDLDTLQFPNRSLVDYEKYHPYIGQSMVKNSITVQFSRGCIFKCLYCFKIWPDKYSLRSGENLFEEVNMYYNMGIRRFGFTDDLPNFNKKEIGKFYQLVIKNKLKIHMHYPNGIRGDILTPDFIDLMMEAGAVTMDLALETASPRLQKLIRKNVNIERLHRNVEYIIENYPRAILGVQIMHGFPTETEEEARASLEFIKSFRWLPFGYMHILKIYPNTAMARFAMEHGISEESIVKSMDLGYHELPYTLPFSESFTRQCQAEYLGEFFLNKERLRNVLPNQMAMLTEDELVQKYNSYLPVDIKTFLDLLNYIGIARDEIKGEFLPEDYGKVENFNEKVRQYFPVHKNNPSSTRLLLLDLSQHFSHERLEMYHVVDPPLGLMYLLTYLNKIFGERITGKIAKSQVDFDNYAEMKALVENFKPDIIGVRSMNYFRNFCHKSLALIRQWGFDGPIIAGGPYATSSYDIMLQDTNIDLAVLEEGEITMAELMTAIMNNGGKLPDDEVLKNIQGIAFLEKDEKSRLRQRCREVVLSDRIADILYGESNQNPEPINNSNDLAYIIYTSGSTGIPKGALIQHRNIVNQLTGLKKKFQLDASFNYLLLAAITFDVSVMHLFSALTTGAKIFLVSEEVKKDPLKLWPFIHDNKINILNIVPAFMKVLLENIEKDKIWIKYLFVGGDTFSPELYVALKETFRTESILNIYGPTETTINAALYLCDGITLNQRIPIGKPLMNYRLYILDNDFNPVPIGGQGELCISGEGVARGYLNQPQLTAEKFIPNPFVERAIMYRSGDQARWLPDGNIEFLGRVDQQVKIRGFRIELGEIEKHLREMEDIKEAVVLVKEDERGDKNFCAYVVSSRLQVASEIRDCLGAKLPNYMIPTYIVQVDKMPLTASGKIDTRGLRKMTLQVKAEYIPPTTEVERKLVQIWSDVLGIAENTISLNANFFDLGGHSLKATILISKIHKTFDVKIPLVQLFKTPTLMGLSGYITMKDARNDKDKKAKYLSIDSVEKKEYYPLSPAQERLFFFQQMNPDSISYNLTKILVFEGEVDKDRLKNTFKKLIQRHESLRTSFELIDGEPAQRIFDDIAIELEQYDDGYDSSDSPREAGKRIQRFVRAFDLSQVPLLRVGITKSKNGGYILMVDMHHIISDGVSQQVLEQDYNALYVGNQLPPLKLQYKDYSQWQHQQSETNAFKRQQEYWLKQLAGEIPRLKMPLDYPRTFLQSFEGRVIAFELDAEITMALNEMARQEESTLFMVLLSIYYILLFHVSHQEDILVGTATAGRGHADLEKIIGMFVNMLALRNFPSGEKRFVDFLDEVKLRSLEAFENQDYRFEDLIEKVAQGRDIGHHLLFDVVFAMENMSKIVPQEPPLPVSQSQVAVKAPIIGFENNTTKFELTLTANERGEKLYFTFQYCTKLYRAETISRLIKYFKAIVSSVLVNPRQKISEICILSETDREELIKKMRGDDYSCVDVVQSASERTTELEAEFDY